MGKLPATTNDPKYFTEKEALRLERVAIWGEKRADDCCIYAQQSALCLSGGGIRSAAFCLGVLQALAKAGLLNRFHYLSTVSGGGYIGAWLQAWLLEHARKEHARKERQPYVCQADIDAVSAELASDVAPLQLGHLRDFTNFLAPEAGLASRDTWAALTLYVRNILINWAVFMPVLFALALVPGLYRDILAAELPDWVSHVAFAMALLGAGFAAYFTCTWLPSHVPDKPASRGGQEKCPNYASIKQISVYSVLPAMVWAGLLPLAVAPCLIHQSSALTMFGCRPVLAVPVATFLVLMVAYGSAWVSTAIWGREPWLFWVSLRPWLIACVVAVAVLAAEIWLAQEFAGGPDRTPILLAILGPVAAMLSHLCLSSAFVALRVEVKRSDLDREWLARLSAVKVLPMLLWAIVAGICLLGPMAVASLDLGPIWTSTTAIVSVLSGAAGALFGSSSKTSAVVQKLTSFDVLAALCTLVFAVGLLVLFSYLGMVLTGLLVEPAASRTHVADPLDAALVGLALVGAAAFIGWYLGGRINVNRFSLQGVYRNRLIRAFLGSARDRVGETEDAPKSPSPLRLRTPDPFTDFDPEDNLHLKDLMPARDDTRRLFPVIGTTLNLVRGATKAGQERKGAPFFITPTTCGFLDSERKKKSFIETGKYAGAEQKVRNAEPVGMTLGTAMTLSGAAVSPNMGYHSSPSTAFLMTLFNVRLGGWLPNPASQRGESVKRSKPPNALKALYSEMLGLTDEESSAIYLSDGGHFDNLGLYEMIRRRCARIIVVDASQDGEFGFADLAASVRKIRIDFDVEIEFRMPMPMVTEIDWTNGAQPYALADVKYSARKDRPKMCGKLLYIKSCGQPPMPIDVRGYANQDAAFPADSTADQFFSESQFESYRRLGKFIGDQAAADTDGELRAFLDDIRRSCDSPESVECAALATVDAAG